MNTQPFTAASAPFLSQARAPSLLCEGAYLAFLLLIFIGLAPFAVRDIAALSAGQSAATGTGDAVRQIGFLGVFALIAGSSLLHRGDEAKRSVPLLLVALLAWCLLSASWAIEPAVSFRRAVLASVIVVSAMMSVSAVGPDRALKLLKFALAAVLIINWISIPLVPQAIHLPGELDPGLVGNWRGLYFHKNIAGSVTAITAIIFFFSALSSRRLVDVALFVAATLFTIMTHSKSSIGLLPVAIFFGLVYRFAWRRGIDRAIVGTVAALIAIGCLAAVALDWSAISAALEDPAEFTGRAAIWQGEITFIRDHLFLGSGFGTFSDTGAMSPLHNYVGDAWVQNVVQGHNAYLQLFVTIGGVGFALAIFALIVSPLRCFLLSNESDLAFLSLLFSIFAFMVFHEALESDFLEGDSPAWIAFLLMLGMLKGLPVERRQATT